MKASRLAAAGTLAGTAVLALSAPAFAHVSVQPEGEAAKGGYAVVDFKVPNERDNASTTKLEVTFPTDHPLSSVLPQNIDGWNAGDEVEPAPRLYECANTEQVPALLGLGLGHHVDQVLAE